MKDDQSFVSLGDTFHPDGAVVAVPHPQEAKKWRVVWAEAIVDPEDSAEVVVDAVAVDIDGHNNTLSATGVAVVHTGTSSLHRCNFIVLAVGYSFMIAAVATAFGTELGAVCVYLVASGFYWTAQQLKRIGPLGYPLQLLFLVLTTVLLCVDLLLLTVGIFVVELVAWLGCVICILFGGISVGTYWHQHIRKVCHLTRWAFRGFHSTWSPKRMHAFDAKEPAEEVHTATASPEERKSEEDHDMEEDIKVAV
jgi:hypothetical protein